MMIRWLKRGLLAKKRVLVRVDFNVPTENGVILDDFRIRAHLPTIKLILAGKNVIVLVTHIGKPGGKKSAKLSARPAARRLSRLLGRKVTFLPEPFSPQTRKKILSAKAGEMFLAENVRFWRGEEKNDPRLAKALSDLGEVFVEDAFGVIHRSHASVVGPPRFLPSYGGLLLKKELDALRPLVKKPRRPFVVVMGGAKISTKLRLIKAFSRKADRVLLGGAVANTVLASLGFPVGKSVVEKNMLSSVRKIAMRDRKILFPHDAVVARSPKDNKSLDKQVRDIGKNEMIFDIGSDTRRTFIRELKKAKTIFWNGPLGLIEVRPFHEGTLAVARAFRKIKGYKVSGGGDLLAFLKKHALLSAFNHIATGGGSTLTLLAGKPLPGLEALKKSKKR